MTMPAAHNYLNKLDFGNRHLMIKMDEMKMDSGFSAYYDVTGRGHYIQTQPATIRGKFTVDTVNNSIKDVQDCLGNPFEIRPKLEYSDRRYDIIITTMTWGGLDEVRYGHYVSYHCEFLATPIDLPVAPVQKPSNGNTVIWDAADSTGEFTINDIRDLVGEEDLTVLVDRVVDLIDKYSCFEATADCPTPSSMAKGTRADDLAAVLSGSKPAVMFDEIELSDPLIVLMCTEAHARGYRVDTVLNFGNVRSIVVGEAYNVREIVEIIQKAVKDDAVSEYYYWRLGKLLGYPDEALNKFVKNVKDFGFNRT